MQSSEKKEGVQGGAEAGERTQATGMRGLGIAETSLWTHKAVVPIKLIPGL